MRGLASLARRRFTVGGLLLGGWGFVRGRAGAQAEAAGGTQMQRPRPEMAPPQQQPRQLIRKAFGIKSFAASTMQPRQGDRVVLTLAIENTGSVAVDVPWTIKKATVWRGSNIEGPVVFATGAKRVEPGRTEQVTSEWVASGPGTGVFHRFDAQLDPGNTLGTGSPSAYVSFSVVAVAQPADWPGWVAAAREGAVTGINAWIADVRYVGGAVNATQLTGGALRSGADLRGKIEEPMRLRAGAPTGVAVSFEAAVWDAWKAWADGWTIPLPGVPAYPQFAAYPGPAAPPTANVPFPLNPAASNGLPRLTAGNLAASIKSRVGSAADSQAATAAINDFAGWFAGRFTAWSSGAMLSGILGKGPVPGFAPPYVPVGSVLLGDASSGPGVIRGVQF